MIVKKRFTYKGSCESVFLNTGGYFIEIWGAQGKDCIAETNYSFGGHSKGFLFIYKGTTVSVCVGGKGKQMKGGWNGGGDSAGSPSNCAPGGGGMTDVHIGDEMILIAGGGGGSTNWSYVTTPGGNGGGTKGTENSEPRSGKAGTNETGGIPGHYTGQNYESCDGNEGTKFKGGSGCATASASPGGGGGGYYGGGGGADTGSGGGGSGYVNENYIIKGVTETSNHTGHGLAIITYFDTIGCLTKKPSNRMNLLVFVILSMLTK